MVLATATATLSMTTSVSAMNRWDALAMIESGNDDHAIGSHGEISRYQILPTLWPGGNPWNGQEALNAAREIMRVRLARFERLHKRPVNDVEFYVLWNAPWEVSHPSKTVSKRAERFANLVKASG